MPNAGIRELKAHASEIVRRVSEERAVYTVTSRGQPVAVLLPLQAGSGAMAGEAGQADAAWDEFSAALDAVSQAWPSDLDPLEVLADIRQ